MRILHVLAFLSTFALTPALRAQLVFIPDGGMRTFLNNNIPGVVDGAGYMNTAHPAIPALTSAYLIIGWSGGDFTGLEYLTGVDTFHMTFAIGGGAPSVFNAFPPGCVEIGLSFLQGFALPDFPIGLTRLDIFSCPTISFSSFPSSLEELWVEGSGLPSMPPLPPRMKDIYMSEVDQLGSLNGVLPDTVDHRLLLGTIPALTDIGSLPAVVGVNDPVSVLSLYSLPQLASLPTLPTGVRHLYLQSLDPVGSIPAFPNSLLELYIIGFPQISALPDPSTTVRYLHLSSLPLDSLPKFPDSLQYLVLQYLTQLECIPMIPLGTDTIVTDNILATCIPNSTPTLVSDLPVCNFFNSPNCPDYLPTIGGTVYHDVNSNGIRDAGEAGLPYANITLDPGSTLLGTDTAGFYSYALAAGTYSLSASGTNQYITSIAPAAHSAVLVNASDVDSLNDFGVVLQSNIQDLRVQLVASPAKPGVNHGLCITYTNQGTVPVTGSITLVYDTDLSWITGLPVPDAINGNTVTWNFTALPLGAARNIFVTLNTPITAALGTPIAHSVTADPISTDNTPADNSAAHSAFVVSAYDPNDKAVLPEEMTPAEVASGERIAYTIRFQNTGTAPASRVIITDTLSTDLLWSSMQFLGSSHACTWVIADGTLQFSFDPITLPDSASDGPGSHGFVSFSMQPLPGLLDGVVIGNTANIYFDYNTPVITNEALLTVDQPFAVVDLVSYSLRIWPNPVYEVLYIECSIGTVRHCSLVDVTGRTVMQLDLSDGQNRIQLAHLAGGSYVLRTDDGTAWPIVKR